MADFLFKFLELATFTLVCGKYMHCHPIFVTDVFRNFILNQFRYFSGKIYQETTFG